MRKQSQAEAVLKGTLFEHDGVCVEIYCYYDDDCCCCYYYYYLFSYQPFKGITCLDFSPDLDMVVSGSRVRTIDLDILLSAFTFPLLNLLGSNARHSYLPQVPLCAHAPSSSKRLSNLGSALL